MGAYAETQSNLSQNLENPEKEGVGRIVGGREIKNTTRKWLTESTNRGSKGLTETEQSGSLYGSDLGSSHVCHGCIAWCSCRRHNSGSEGRL